MHRTKIFIITTVFFLTVILFRANTSAIGDSDKAVSNVNHESVWENPSPRSVSKELDIEIQQANIAINAYTMIVHTPLIRLNRISKLTGKEVYLKNDALQISGSFKMRGVAYEVYMAVRSYLRRIDELGDSAAEEQNQPFYVVTQSDGNHGIAMIEAVATAVEVCLSEYPEFTSYVKNIEPIVFTIRDLPENKRFKMEKALARYRKVSGNDQKGAIYGNYKSYKKAKDDRISFINKNINNAVYMEHGGFNMMCGQGSLGLEVHEDLKNLGINKDRKIAVIVPVGAGSLIGMIAGIKSRRPDVIGIIVQTKPYSAFVRSLINQSFESNFPNPEPTVVIQGKPVVFEDGIAVDAPEPSALKVARKIVDCGLVVDPQKNLSSAAPLLYRDLSEYPNPVVGGTTSSTLEALLEYSSVKAIKDADVIILLGAEENVDNRVTEYIKGLSAKLDSD